MLGLLQNQRLSIVEVGGISWESDRGLVGVCGCGGLSQDLGGVVEKGDMGRNGRYKAMCLLNGTG